MLEKGFYNMDCMKALGDFPDNFFDLAIVDPPYGGGNSSVGGGARFGQRFDRYKQNKSTGKEEVEWDIAPDEKYFKELFRVSRNQIVWGGNYFSLPPTRCFLVWDKLTISESFSMAMCEYAWTSFTGNAKRFACAPQGKPKDPRFHPTQKPIALYEWILRLYAKPEYKILDTHVGSASSLIACQRAGLDYWGFEINEHYYALAKQRLENATAQMMIDGSA